jgi:hypothetical protein
MPENPPPNDKAPGPNAEQYDYTVTWDPTSPIDSPPTPAPTAAASVPSNC